MTQDQQSTLQLQAKTIENCLLMKVSGRIDHTNSDGFLNDLTAHAKTVVKDGGMVVDLGGLEFITSAGLRALLLAQRTLAESGAQLVVTRISGVVKEVFRISNFDSLLSVADSPKAAIGQISQSAAEAFFD